MANLVRDLMHHDVITCSPDATLGEVAVLLTKHHVHALLVATDVNIPMGIISDYDLLAGEWLSGDAQGLDAMRKLTAKDLMSSPIDTVEDDCLLKVAAEQLIARDINRLVVVHGGVPIGVISLSDFIRSIAIQERPSRETVADVMSDAILVCRENTPIISAARTLTQVGWRSVLVVDAKGVPKGVVSGKDLLCCVETGEGDDVTVTEIMHPPLTIDIHAPLREAANLMIQKHYHRLVVIDKDAPDAFPLGIISSFDIVAAMAMPGSIWQK